MWERKVKYVSPMLHEFTWVLGNGGLISLKTKIIRGMICALRDKDIKKLLSFSVSGYTSGAPTGV